MTKTRLGTERETERRPPVSQNPENNVMRNVIIIYTGVIATRARLISKSLPLHAPHAKKDPKSFEAFYKRHIRYLSGFQANPPYFTSLSFPSTFSAAVANECKCPNSATECISVYYLFALTSNTLLIAKNVNFSSLHTFSKFVSL